MHGSQNRKNLLISQHRSRAMPFYWEHEQIGKGGKETHFYYRGQGTARKTVVNTNYIGEIFS